MKQSFIKFLIITLAHLSAKNPENSRFGFLSHYKIILFS
jgi:hypothetical protein